MSFFEGAEAFARAMFARGKDEAIRKIDTLRDLVGDFDKLDEWKNAVEDAITKGPSSHRHSYASLLTFINKLRSLRSQETRSP